MARAFTYNLRYPGPIFDGQVGTDATLYPERTRMKFAIDISIFTSSAGAFGNSTGTIELDVIPQIGDTISFAFPKATGLARVAGFTGMLRVKERVLNVGVGSGVLLALDDIVVATVSDAQALAEYLEKGFGLGTNVY